MTSEYQKMIAGEFYRPSDPELRALAQASRQKQAAFNKEENPLKGAEIIKTWFASTGKNLYINTRLMVDYGVNIHLGENFYSNWNLTMLDIWPIRIGDNAMIGPNCQFLTPLHPLDPQERNSGIEYGKPITIGDNFWTGGGVIVLPGVTLGNNVVAGAGAVITKSFGDNVVLAGNPARVIKEIPVK
ncbi:TPA: sugar O-acetyltransferase [Streptococcus pneumoniae]|nr:sugar O-acetyltransferase [Streptococcus pneumoniae]HET5739384.1 sugar O-acetyltransferase [Streptococcus pneumoniae]HET5763071.1 sugar O-acetyltransferase [Streptococcus pneumoniae]HEU0963083.1 sugar O-acetyltransferase [Streptococcus pneumoniae]HEU2924696.1 sugar O-acetyltransferase [Streptococcus pneumoniae]